MQILLHLYEKLEHLQILVPTGVPGYNNSLVHNKILCWVLSGGLSHYVLMHASVCVHDGDLDGEGHLFSLECLWLFYLKEHQLKYHEKENILVEWLHVSKGAQSKCYPSNFPAQILRGTCEHGSAVVLTDILPTQQTLLQCQRLAFSTRFPLERFWGPLVDGTWGWELHRL